MSSSPSQSSSRIGCFGCLGNLLFLAFIGSILFGFAGFSIRIGSSTFGGGFGQPTEPPAEPPPNQSQAVEDAIKQLHQNIEQGQCENIYKQANEQLKRVTSQSDFLTICKQIPNVLGTVQSTQAVDWWQYGEQNADRYILSRHLTKFSKASAQEIIVWLSKDGKLELVSYQLNPIGLQQTPMI